MNSKNFFMFFVLFTGSLVLVSCTKQADQTNQTRGKPLPLQEATTPATENKSIQENTLLTKITLDDLSLHNNNADCWMAVEGKVYNVTDYVTKHPGGEKILLGCGKDATDLFNAVAKHEIKAKDMLPDFYVGDLAK